MFALKEQAQSIYAERLPEAAVDYLVSLPYVDADRIGGLGICGSGSYMPVAGMKELRLKAILDFMPRAFDEGAPHVATPRPIPASFQVFVFPSSTGYLSLSVKNC
ncbi:MAG: hypothetical protein ACI3Y8_00510 [Candidatus Cryptobacteroides sp.]